MGFVASSEQLSSKGCFAELQDFMLLLNPSFLALVWFSLPGLAVHLFDKRRLCSIVSPIGRPLFVDTASANLTKPSVARICVEFDLLRDSRKRVRLGIEGETARFWQKIKPENLLSYCSGCWRQGHSTD